MANAVANLTQHLEHVSEALNVSSHFSLCGFEEIVYAVRCFERLQNLNY